jgi:hypothetical protein
MADKPLPSCPMLSYMLGIFKPTYFRVFKGLLNLHNKNLKIEKKK